MESEWPELAYKLPPKKPQGLTVPLPLLGLADDTAPAAEAEHKKPDGG